MTLQRWILERFFAWLQSDLTEGWIFAKNSKLGHLLICFCRRRAMAGPDHFVFRQQATNLKQSVQKEPAGIADLKALPNARV